MYKGESINPQLNKLMSQLGHTDLIGVCDAGLPIPLGVERIDLAWKQGKPEWLEVCKLIKSNVNIEKIFLSEDIKTVSGGMNSEFIIMFSDSDIEIAYLKHDEFKSKLKECRGIVRTGEFTSFANCIFVAGVDF